jgi:hypothetical protein
LYFNLGKQSINNRIKMAKKKTWWIASIILILSMTCFASCREVPDVVLTGHTYQVNITQTEYYPDNWIYGGTICPPGIMFAETSNSVILFTPSKCSYNISIPENTFGWGTFKGCEIKSVKICRHTTLLDVLRAVYAWNIDGYPIEVVINKIDCWKNSY